MWNPLDMKPPVLEDDMSVDVLLYGYQQSEMIHIYTVGWYNFASGEWCCYDSDLLDDFTPELWYDLPSMPACTEGH